MSILLPLRPLLLVPSIMFLPATRVNAGMPSASLTDLAAARIDAISFFLLGLLLSAAVIQWLWNLLRRDFTTLPRLTYGRSLGLMMVWGLMFVLVLTMISGARELMTPAAWKKDGWTWRLVDPPRLAAAAETDQTRDLTARRVAIERLFARLTVFAARHDGRFPSQSEYEDLPPADRQWIDRAGMTYLYLPGGKIGEDETPIAFEPALGTEGQYTLYANGDIRLLAPEALRRVVDSTEP